MPFEIEMLAVGAADAIILRYIDERDREFVILIDAGNRKDGKKVVDSVKKWTKNKYIDLAICTHPDADHIGGFFYVINNIDIKEFWIHDPAKHKNELDSIRKTIHSSKILKKGLQYVIESLQDSDNIISLIDSMKIKRDREPFSGIVYEFAPLKVVSPSKDYYEELLNNFRDIELLLPKKYSILKSLGEGGIVLESAIANQMLDRFKDRSKENNSSVVLLFEPENLRYLFTSDAGPDALDKAHHQFNLSNLDWLDVPHHGSKYNLSSSLIKIFKPGTAYISCDGSNDCPSNVLVEELKSLGCNIFSTQDGYNKKHQIGMQARPGYSDATPL